MMGGIRKALGYTALALITVGYLASVFAAVAGDAADYALRVDQPPIWYLSLALLLGAMVLSIVPVRGEGDI